MSDHTRTVGKSELRKDAWDKVKGVAQYVADIHQKSIFYGAIVRSQRHHARIISIDTEVANDLPGVIKVITAEDIPGKKFHGPIVQDQPILAIDLVRHLGEPVALVVAESRKIAKSAVEIVKIDYEPYDPVFDPIMALQPGAMKLHREGNLVAEFNVSDGDIESGFSDADIILEETFKVPRISPAYLETENSLARMNSDGSLTIWVSSQHPFTDQTVVAETLGLPVEKVQIKCAVIGGAFGGKEDSTLAVLAALGAWTIKGTVQLVNNRQESFLAHPKRHPAQICLKIGAKIDGTLTTLKAAVHMDTGAYASYGPAVGVILTETLTGSYRFPNVELKTLVVYTNSPLSGAMRGFGSPQSHFAVESILDILATELNIDPLVLRRMNILRPGDRMFTQVMVNETALSLPKCLDDAEEIIAEFRKIAPPPGMEAGVGMALAAQSMGLGAKIQDDSTHRLKWLPDGRVLLFLGSPDMGQGLAMVAEQIIAETLELPYETVKSVELDTLISPNGNVTCASRMTYMVGNSVIDASQKLIEKLLIEASQMLNIPRNQLDYQDGSIIAPDGERVTAAEIISSLVDDGRELVSESTFNFPYPEETTPLNLPIGMPHVMFCYGAQIVRVEVDPELGKVDVTHLAAIHDVGKVISKSGVEGQIEGGVATGLGYALYENMLLKEPGNWVDGFTEYLIPTIKDLPEYYRNIILEIPEASGPYGAKGIGEVTLVPTAPAVANAVYDAIGLRVKELPITPEKLVRYN